MRRPEQRRSFSSNHESVAGIPDHWFPREDLDASSSAFAVLFADAERSRPHVVGADSWFDQRDAGRFRLTEQSVKAHGGEILTLLTLTDSGMLG